MPQLRTALLIVGLQNDHCSGGAIGVKGAERSAAPLSYVANAISQGGGLVLVLREWHSEASPWFRPNGGELEPYCVAGSPGAALHRDLRLPPKARFLYRADDPAGGASAFLASGRRGESLEELLREAGVERLLLGGSPAERAIRATALGALRRGFALTLVQDGIAAAEPRRGGGSAQGSALGRRRRSRQRPAHYVSLPLRRAALLSRLFQRHSKERHPAKRAQGKGDTGAPARQGRTSLPLPGIPALSRPSSPRRSGLPCLGRAG